MGRVHSDRWRRVACAVGPLLLLASASLAACGGDPPAGPAADEQEDVTAVGRALLDRMDRATREGDAAALFGLLSEAMREEGRARIRRLRERLQAAPEEAERLREQWQLERNPLEMSVDELVIAEARSRVRDRGGAPAGAHSLEFVDATLRDDRLFIRARPPTSASGGSPSPERPVTFVWLRQQGEWRLDPAATEEHESRWVRSISLPDGEVWALEVTPDGSHVVLGRSAGLEILPLEGDGKAAGLVPHGGGGFAVDPSGRWLATCSRGSESAGDEPGTFLWGLPNGDRRRRISAAPAEGVVVSPDGALLAVEESDGVESHIALYPASGEGARRTLPVPDVAAMAFAGGDRLVVTRLSGDITVLALDGRRLLRIPNAVQRDRAGSLAVHGPTGRIAVLADAGPDDVAVVLYDLESGEELWRQGVRGAWQVRCSPDGSEVAVGPGQVRRFESRTGRSVGTHSRASAPNQGPIAFHPSGRLLFAIGRRLQRVAPAAGTPDGPPPPWIHVYACDR